MIQFIRAQHIRLVPIAKNFRHHVLHIVEILLGLQRVINAVVALLIQFSVGDVRVVAEMRPASGFNETMGHERTR